MLNQQTLLIRKGCLKIGCAEYSSIKQQTAIFLRKGAKWIVDGDVSISYRGMIDIQRDAIMESGFFTANVGCTIICSKHIRLGKNVMLGRNVIIYDSDHHQILDKRDMIKNKPMDVIIGDNVWLATRSMVLKGVKIGSGSIVAAGTIVTKDLPDNATVVGGSAKIVNTEARWNRRTNNFRQ